MTKPFATFLAIALLAFFPTFASAQAPVRASTRPAQRANLPQDTRILRDIEYARPDDRPQLLDLYIPANTNAPRPLVIWVHGGAWKGGDKRSGPFAPLIEAGYVVASINYRLSQQALFPAQILDCKSAVRFLRAHASDYSIDPNYVGVWGSSAGGHLVALIGTSANHKDFDKGDNLAQSSAVQAVVDWFGPTDLLRIAEQAPPNSAIEHNAPDSPESLLIGGPVQQNPEKAAAANPITYITDKSPPFLIMHGDRDNLVPIGQSRILEDALKKHHVPVTLVEIPGAGHGGQGFDTPQRRNQIVNFFNLHLKPAPATQPAPQPAPAPH